MRLNDHRYAGDLQAVPGESADVCVVGLSTGLLAAAAVALSPSVPALTSLGVEVVLVAFRLGLYVQAAAGHLECLGVADQSLSWSYTVSGVSRDEAQKKLDVFHQEKVPSLKINGQVAGG